MVLETEKSPHQNWSNDASYQSDNNIWTDWIPNLMQPKETIPLTNLLND